MQLTPKGEEYVRAHDASFQLPAGLSPATIDFLFGNQSAGAPPLDLPPFAEQPGLRRQSAERLLNWMIERELELMVILDFIDGDNDLEEQGDGEPWIGWAEGGQPLREGDMSDDRKVGNADWEDDGTTEPTLGAEGGLVGLRR